MADHLKGLISGRVLAARNHAGLTQEQLAEVIERSVEAVSNIERGISLPTLDTIDRVAKAASVPITFFFEDLPTTSIKPANSDIAVALTLIVGRLTTRDAGLLMSLAQSMEQT